MQKMESRTTLHAMLASLYGDDCMDEDIALPQACATCEKRGGWTFMLSLTNPYVCAALLVASRERCVEW